MSDIIQRLIEMESLMYKQKYSKMSMIKYGLISETDARTIEKTIDLICDEFPNEILHTCEIGVYSGLTSKGIIQYIFNVKKRVTSHTGIDNGKDNQLMTDWFEAATFIKGNSNEVYNQLEDNSQHLIFDDGDHSLIGVISDFFAYADKVKVGGYFAFHDTGRHIKPFKDFQHGDKENPHAYISVRSALEKIGLFSEYLHYAFDTGYPLPEFTKWQLVFDEADETNEAGGLIVFKRMK